MNQFKFIRRGLAGAFLLLAAAAPFTFTSCEAEHAQVNITLNSDYTELVAAMKDSNKSLIEKLGLIQAAINGGFANNKTALDLIKEAIGTLNGTVDQKLAAIEEAIKSQTTTLDTKLGLIQAAIQTGLADNKTALEQLKTAIESLKGSVDGIDSSIDDIVTSLNGLKGALDTDIAALLQGIIDSIDGIQDYSEILTAIKAAIENIGVDPDAYDAGAPAQAVDLDLPSGIKWASYNIGASKPEEYGDYFAWGETKPYYTPGHAQDVECTNWREGKTGYNFASYFDSVDGSDENFKIYALDKESKLRPEHDAATVNWGGTWRMPTEAEQDEIREKCDWEWTEVNGVNGYKVSSKSNSSKYIFLPAAGYREVGSLNNAGSYGLYASSSHLNHPDYLHSDCTYGVFLNPDYVYWNPTSRDFGQSIRAVCP